jgi:hypothetical protein
LQPSGLWKSAASSFEIFLTTYQIIRFQNQENQNLNKSHVEDDDKKNDEDTNKAGKADEVHSRS